LSARIYGIDAYLVEVEVDAAPVAWVSSTWSACPTSIRIT
jgi:hypothetical protein